MYVPAGIPVYAVSLTPLIYSQRQVVAVAHATPAAAASEQTLAEAEREHILRVLEKTGWRVKGPKRVAAKLGINPSTLVSRMKKQGLLPRRQTQIEQV